MLSILIPTFNSPVFQLVQELHFQCSRKGLSFEIIVCDDASSEKIQHNHTTINLSNYTLIKNKVNKGRSVTRKLLAEKAIFPWILFLDADVYPKSQNFIRDYINIVSNTDNPECFFGGIAYEKEKPSNEKILRWIYGKKRESKTASKRNRRPYILASGNLLIKKELFLELNIFVKNVYGLDNIFSNELKRKKIDVLHIDNEVYHLGLETNAVFLKKSIESLKTTILFEKEGKIDPDLRTIQRVYSKLHFFMRSQKIVGYLLQIFNKKIEINLLGKNPSLVLFDLYRLYHYIKLKSRA